MGSEERIMVTKKQRFFVCAVCLLCLLPAGGGCDAKDDGAGDGDEGATGESSADGASEGTSAGEDGDGSGGVPLTLGELKQVCSAEASMQGCRGASELLEEAMTLCELNGEDVSCGCQWRQTWTVNDACEITEDPGGSCVGYTIAAGGDGCVGGTQLGECDNLYFGASSGVSFTVAMVNDDCDANLGIDGEVCAGFDTPSPKCACAEQLVSGVCNPM